METKHTTGPWHTTKPSESNGYVWVNPIDGCCGEVATAWSTSQGSAEANARLIAAAPDLLESLEMIVSEADSYTARTGKPVYNWLDQARAAIAKAKGEEQR